MKSSPWKNRFRELADAGLDRHMRSVSSPHGPRVETPSGTKLMFCSNDYLGLSNHPRIVSAVQEGAKRWGLGSAGSRLISGNTNAHDTMEQRFASFAGTDSAVFFPSGYHANVGAIPALTGEGDMIFSDELTHASIVDGCRLSRAETRVFRHRDIEHLDSLLAAEQKSDGLRLIITDAVFSMDGDVAPLEDIVRIAEKHDAHVYLDEAHSVGLLGEGGRGLATATGLAFKIAVRVFPLGKAFGSAGGVVACDEWSASILRSRARSLLYTTGAPAMLAEGISTGIELLKNADAERQRLLDLIKLFRQLSREARISLLPSETPIQPILIGSTGRTMRVSEALWERGLFVQGIRPPTVAEGTARLRITLCAFHTDEHIETLVDQLRSVLKELK